MRWKKKPPKQKPQRGDTRSVFKFALFPTLMSNNIDVVWLETYRVDQTLYYYKDSWGHTTDRIWLTQRKYLV